MTDAILTNAGLEAIRQKTGDSTSVAAQLVQAAGLAQTRGYGAASTVKETIGPPTGIIRGRVFGAHSAIWTSGVFVRYDLPATPVIVQDRGDPSKYVFRLTDTGSGYFAGGIAAASIDIPSVGATGFHVSVTGETGWGGTNASGGTLHVDPASGDVNSAGTFTLTGSTGAFRTASSGTRIEMSRSGTAYERIKLYDPTNTVSPNYIQVQGGASSTSVVVVAGATDVGSSPPSLYGARVSVINDTTSSWVYAQADRHVWHGSAADAEWNALGGYLNVGSASTPAAPSSNDVRVWDSSGTLKWKTATTTYDLSKTLDILTTTGDTSYASAANTPARLAGNTTTTKQFLSQTGNGSVSAAPVWSTIDLSTSSVTGILAAARFPALTGDVTTSSGAIATTIANNAVSYAKMQDVSATSRFLGRITAGAGDPEELTAANAKTILALQASDLSDNANLAKLNAGNTFTVTPQTLTIDAAGHVGLQINLAPSQTGRAIQVTDSDGVQAFQLAGSGADILISQYAASPQITGRRAEGTNTSPTAVAADSVGLGLGFRGYGTSFATQDKAQIALTAAELWSATNQGTYIAFLTTKKAGTTRAEVLRLTDDGGMRITEVTTPAAPPANGAIIYADDNGAGKTRLLCLFNTGAAQVIATQP